jgi:hypothetical protein
MGKPKAPDGYPNEFEFCKGKFSFHRSGEVHNSEQLYKLDNLLVIVTIDLAEAERTFEVKVCATSKDHVDHTLASGRGTDLSKALKKAEKEFQSTYYKMKPLMER